MPDANIVNDEGTPIHPTPMTDILMNAEVLLSQGDYLRLVKGIRQSVDLDGKVIVHNNDIPVLNTIISNVEFIDGAVKP